MAHVVMLVHSDYYHDNRVVREAELLAAERYKVTVLAAEFGLSEPYRQGYQNGVEVITCQLNSASGKWRFLQMMRIFSKKLKHIRADVVHAHDLDTLLPAWLYARIRGIPLIYDSHELYLESTGLQGRWLNQAVWAVLERVLIHRTAAVITVCNSIALYLKSNYKLKNEPVVIRNFSSAGAERDVSELPYRIQEFRTRIPYMCIYQGVLRKGRGLSLIPDIIAGNENWGAVLCGDGPMKAALQEQIAGLGLEDRVILAGLLPHNLLASVTAVADAGFCFIEPVSLSYRFALPNKLSEYVQARIPVIGSNLPEIAQIIDEYQIGFVCNDETDISEALKQLENSKIRNEIGKHLDLAAPELSWDKEGRKLADLYEKLA